MILLKEHGVWLFAMAILAIIAFAVASCIPITHGDPRGVITLSIKVTPKKSANVPFTAAGRASLRCSGVGVCPPIVSHRWMLNDETVERKDYDYGDVDEWYLDDWLHLSSIKLFEISDPGEYEVCFLARDKEGDDYIACAAFSAL